MKMLGLSITKGVSFTITLADQRKVKPLGVVEKVTMTIQGCSFELEFVVISLPEESSFPLLLGRPWLRQARALQDWGKNLLWVKTSRDNHIQLHMDPDKDNLTGIMQIDPPKDEEALLSWLVGNLDCCEVEMEPDNPSEFMQMSKESAKQRCDKLLCETLHTETCTGNRTLGQKGGVESKTFLSRCSSQQHTFCC
ncbi:hypothetical protein KP509_32G039000 [Ceratopteris richardii]|nr:hypothetical protein KP509_32G039000 [Ceratopteris richardii]